MNPLIQVRDLRRINSKEKNRSTARCVYTDFRLLSTNLGVDMSVIANLKVVAAKRPEQQPMIVKRRNKLISQLHDQLELAQAESEGREYLKARRRHVKNTVTGEYSEAMVSKKPRAWYWTADDGKIYLNIRYGTRVLELAKGKSAIEIGERKQLVPTIEALKQAVAAGEIDTQLTAAGDEVGLRFKNRSRNRAKYS